MTHYSPTRPYLPLVPFPLGRVFFQVTIKVVETGCRGGHEARAWQEMAVLFPPWGITNRLPEPKIEEDNSFKCCLHILLLPVLHSSKVYSIAPNMPTDWGLNVQTHEPLWDILYPMYNRSYGDSDSLLFPLKTGTTGAQVEVM